MALMPVAALRGAARGAAAAAARRTYASAAVSLKTRVDPATAAAAVAAAAAAPAAAPRRRRRLKSAAALPKGDGVDFVDPAAPPPQPPQPKPSDGGVSGTSIPVNVTSGDSPAGEPKLTALQRRQRKGAAKEIVQLTENAAARIRELLSRRDDSPAGVSIGVKKRGCNGLSYTMEYYFPENKPVKTSAFEATTTQHGVAVHVDGEAFMFVVGTVMDFERNKTEEKFVFINPNSGGSCGCGESFVPKKDEA